MNILFNYIFIIYMFLLPIIPDVINGRSTNIISQGLLGIMILFYIVKFFFFNKNKIETLRDFFTDPMTILMTILSLIMAISSFEGVNLIVGLKETIRFASYVVIYYIVKYDDIDYSLLIKACILSIGIILCFGIIQFFTGIGGNMTLGGYRFIRVQSTIDNPNSYGGYLNILIFPLFMMIGKITDKKKKILLYVGIILILINIAMTMSRNALLGLGIGMVIFIILYNVKAIIGFIAVAVALIAVPSVRARILDIFDVAQNMSRVGIWKMAIDLSKEHFLTGIGNGNFPLYYPKLKPNYVELAEDYAEVYPTHNSYLKVQSELGIFGTITFMSMIVCIFYKIRKAVKTIDDEVIKAAIKGFNISFIVFLIMNCIDNLFFVPKIATLVYVIIAMIDGMVYRDNKKTYWYR